MHKALQNTLRPRQAALARPAKGAWFGRRTTLLAGLAGLFVIVLAWIDGGEEPLHTIVQPIAVPGEGGGS